MCRSGHAGLGIISFERALARTCKLQSCIGVNVGWLLDHATSIDLNRDDAQSENSSLDLKALCSD